MHHIVPKMLINRVVGSVLVMSAPSTIGHRTCAVFKMLASPLYTAPCASSTLRGSDAHLPAGNSDLLSWFRLLAWFLNWDFAVHLRKTPKNWVVKSTLIGHHPCLQ